MAILHAIQDEVGYVPPDGRRAARAGAVAVARRSSRRHHLLPSLPLGAARARHRAAVPRGSVPQHGHGSAGGAHRRPYGLQVRQRSSRGNRARIRVLPRSMRAVAVDDDQRRAVRAESRRRSSTGFTRAGAARKSRRKRHDAHLRSLRFVRARARRAKPSLPPSRAKPQKRGIDVQIVRNGSRGLLWLEPLVEVETAEGRIGYSNVEADDVAALFDAGFHRRRRA